MKANLPEVPKAARALLATMTRDELESTVNLWITHPGLFPGKRDELRALGDVASKMLATMH